MKRNSGVALLLCVAAASAILAAGATPTNAPIEITVTEGTSMSVAVSPDGQTLAIDLQGSIWTLPATGGQARRITDVFNDARQPTWSPDGKTIAFFGYRDGGYDLWTIAPDGTNQRKLTWGNFDDREPIYSHDGTRIAFSSDRGDPLGSDYNIWVLDLRSGALRQMTKDPADDYMPTWSPDDKEIAFTSMRENSRSIWAVALLDGAPRRITDAKVRADAPSWGPGGEIVHHVAGGGQSRLESGGKSSLAPRTHSRSASRGPRRPSSSTSPTERYAGARLLLLTRRRRPSTSPPPCRSPGPTTSVESGTSPRPLRGRSSASSALSSPPMARALPLPRSTTST